MEEQRWMHGSQSFAGAHRRHLEPRDRRGTETSGGADRQRTATIKETVTQDGWLDVHFQGADVICHSFKVPWHVPYKG
jgi:hypothetical protein